MAPTNNHFESECELDKNKSKSSEDCSEAGICDVNISVGKSSDCSDKSSIDLGNDVEIESESDSAEQQEHEQMPWEAPKAQGLYNPENEHEACGVGFIVAIDGKRNHKVRFVFLSNNFYESDQKYFFASSKVYF